MIPRILHMIWLGPPMPEHLVAYGRRWQELHPDWEFRLWREGDLRWLANQDLFDRAAELSPRNVGQFASNIARYEILLREGGVYTDCDMEPRRPIDVLLEGTDCFTAWHPATENYDDRTYLTNALMGAVPGHPVFASLVDGIAESVESNAGLRSIFTTGVRYMTRRLRAEGLIDAMTVYPAVTFYPYGTDELDDAQAADAYPESFAVHRWNNRTSGNWAGRAA
jgi:mannosyltransferase OCH1-like enzyme